jgi:hypothetical protein
MPKRRHKHRLGLNNSRLSCGNKSKPKPKPKLRLKHKLKHKRKELRRRPKMRHNE